MSKDKDLRKFTDIVERIEHLRKHLGLNKSRFSGEIGMKPQTYNNFIGSQGSKPNVELIFGIVNIFGVNPIWLLNGQGSMFLSEAEKVAAELAEGIPMKVANYGKFGEGENGYYTPVSNEEAAKLQKEIEALEVHLEKIDAQLKHIELQKIPALDRMVSLLRKYYELDPFSALSEFKDMLKRIEKRVGKHQ